MRAILCIFIFVMTSSALINAQNVGINDDGSTPASSAMLDVKSSDKGFLVPRTDTSSVNSSHTPENGLLIYNPTDLAYYYYAGNKWQKLEHPLTDTDGDTGIEFEQNPDDDILRFTVDGFLVASFLKGPGGIYRMYTNFKKDNLFIGKNTGFNTGLDSTFINSGKFNTGIGDDALVNNTNGLENTAVGHNSLRFNITGYGNTAIGAQTLLSNNGFYNTAVGVGAMDANLSGNNNSALGLNAGAGNKSGNNSVFIGRRTGVFDTSSVNNVYIGNSAGAGGPTSSTSLHKKQDNVMVGAYSGENNQGDANIFIGYESGQNETGSNRLYIENSSADANNALIYGEFDTDLLRINGDLNINGAYTFPSTDGLSNRVLKTNGSGSLFWSTDNNGHWTKSGSEVYYTGYVGIGDNNPSYQLDVKEDNPGGFVSRILNADNGTKASGLIIDVATSKPTTDNVLIQFIGDNTVVGAITGDGANGVIYGSPSDRRLKQGIIAYHSGLETVKKINAYEYAMKANPEEKQIGFIAQELYEILPHIVRGTPSTSSIEDPMMVDYAKITPVLLAAIKELIAEKESLSNQLEDVKKTQETNNLKLASLETRLSQLEATND